MTANRMKTGLSLAAAGAVLFVLLVAGSAAASPVTNRFLLASHIGLRVNGTTGGNICTVASKDECVAPPLQNGEPIETSLPGAFKYPQGVAIDGDAGSLSFGDVYVVDTSNRRVQELTATGVFVRMFGGEVNETKDKEPHASQAEKDICVAGEACTAGVEGSAPGQFSSAVSIAVDPASGDVYVTDESFGESNEEFALAQRIQKFTATGQFVLEIGKEVNQTTKGNLCTEEEIEKAGVKCASAALRTPAAAEAGSEPGAFNFESEHADLLAIGGPHDLLYVGDQGRIQEFKASGEPAGEIPLTALSATGRATGVAVDPTGDVFLSDTEAPGIHEYNTSNTLQPTVIDPTSTGIRGIALDANGQLGVLEGKEIPGKFGFIVVGALYNAAGAKLSEFTPPSGSFTGFPVGLAFAASGELYIPTSGTQEVEAYVPVVFPEARTCRVEEVTATSAKLCGEINPDEVPAVAFFQYGTSPAVESQTPVLFEGAGETFAPISSLTSLEPNQTYHYRAAVQAEVNGEKLTGQGEEQQFHTPAVPVAIMGAPSASFLTAQTALLSASLNPEHLATRYHFEYGACPTLNDCASVLSTADEESSQYGVIGSTQELRGLAANTTYSYRLVASNETEEAGKTIGGKATGPEGTFTTGAPPTVQAATGAASSVTSTSALVAGTVNPDGQPATYTFELGIYAGTATQYGVVFSGPTGAETSPVSESLPLTGLQPGTTYAYKITIHGGYGTAEGQPATFTTQGLPSTLSAPPVPSLLATPAIAFPKTTLTTSKKAKAKKTRRRAHKQRRHAKKPKPHAHKKQRSKKQ